MKNYKICDICGHKYPSGHPCLNCKNKYPGNKITPEVLGNFVSIMRLKKNDHIIIKLENMEEENLNILYDAFNKEEYRKLNISLTVLPIESDVIVIREDEQESENGKS